MPVGTTALLESVRKILIILIIFLLSLQALSKVPNLQMLVKVHIIKTTGPVEMYAAQQWYSRLFIPYEEYVPKDLSSWKNCDFRIKNQVDLSRNMESVTKCKMEVALGLTMWKYVLDETENVDLSSLKEYGVPEDVIEEMERTIKEQVSTLKGKGDNEKKAALAISAEKIKSTAETLGERWFQERRR